MERADELIRLLEGTGALMRGHYRLTSGLHADTFLLSSQLTQYPEKCAAAAAMLAVEWRDRDIQTVVGTAFGGLLIGYELAKQIGARFVFAEKVSDTMQLRRGFTLHEGERVLITEDVVTTGGSARKALDAISAMKPHVVGVTALWDRSAGVVDFGVPFFALINEPLRDYSPEQCPLCQAGQALIIPKAS